MIGFKDFINEVSQKTLNSYSKLADREVSDIDRKIYYRRHTGLDKNLMKKRNNRLSGLALAGKKFSKKARESK